MKDFYSIIGFSVLVGLVIGFGAINFLKIKKQETSITLLIISTIFSLFLTILGYSSGKDFDLGTSSILSTFGSFLGITIIYSILYSNEKKKQKTVISQKYTNVDSKPAKMSTIKQKKKDTTIEKTAAKITKNEIIELKDSIGKNNIESIIQEMKDKFKNKNLSDGAYNELIIIESRYNQLKSSSRKGVLRRDDETLEENKIRNSLLTLIDLINEK